MPDKSNVHGPEEVEKDFSTEEPRIGVYVCNCGGNIGDVVGCPKVAKSLSGLPNVITSRSHMFMCSDPGQDLILRDIKEKGVNRVVIGACSPFLHETTFRGALERAGLNPYLYTHVGLREQDSWVHHDFPKEATEKAVFLMAAGIAKARLIEPLEPIRLEAKRHVLVIGGGVAGLRAAWDNARRGLKVTLVEKSPFVGGRMARLNQVFPDDASAIEQLSKLIEQIRNHENIDIYTMAEVVEASGYVGDFRVVIQQQSRGISADFEHIAEAIKVCPIRVQNEFNYGLTERPAILKPYPGAYPAIPAIDWQNCDQCGECLKVNGHGGINLQDKVSEIEVNVGAVVMATGFRPYEPFQGEFGYGDYPEVITLPQLERLLAEDGPTSGRLEWGSRPIRKIAMIHCVGSRQTDGVDKPQADGQVNDYCSRVCCTATLRSANEIRQRFPEVDVFDFYRDMRTYGRGHEDIYRQASKNRVMFFRYPGEEPPVVTRTSSNDDHALILTVKDSLTWGEEIEVPVDLVVLAVGMMPSPVPDLIDLFKIAPGKERFLQEVHPKLRPVETAVPGVFLAGTAQGPMNIQESSAAASAASAKVAGLLAQGEVELEPFVARVNLERCEGIGECMAACPYDGAILLQTVSANGQSAEQAVVTPANCKGCGACVGACPNRAIDLLGWTLDQYDAMIDALTDDYAVREMAA
jgi:heterodisulfide reductase subunit A